MKNIYLEDLLDETDSSIYKLVTLATRRALEIAAGAPALVDSDVNTKPTTVALREIAEGKVKFKKAK